jgi:hypothetical protein
MVFAVSSLLFALFISLPARRSLPVQRCETRASPRRDTFAVDNQFLSPPRRKRMPLGCGCLFALAAAAAPRLALLFIWLFTPLVNRAFQSLFLLPLLGIIFLPFSTLMYVLFWVPPVGVTGWGWLWVGLGLLLDISTYANGAYSNRSRIAGGYQTPL